MEINKQNQTAGDNSQQLQAGSIGNLTIVTGITEQRAREIFREMNEIARKDYTSDAYELAVKRVTMFESLLMDKIPKIDGLLEAFGDPSFQYLLADAQRRAAASERENDYAMLTELLGCRAKHGDDRKIRAGISQAVKIVDEVDDDALCGLTMSYAINRIYPLDPSCSTGLDKINDAFGSLLYQTLPKGNEWLEHLEVLNAVRIRPLVGISKFETIFERQLEGYVCVGIKKDSEEYMRAMEIVRNNSLPSNTLVDHEWNDGYVRLAIPNLRHLDGLMVGTSTGKHMRPLNSREKGSFRQIWDLYSKDSGVFSLVKGKFVDELKARPHIATIIEWWNRMPNAFSLTHVGVVLAHANAQNHVKGMPDLFEL